MTIADAAYIARMPAGPDKAEVMAFRTFLQHHPYAKPCDCGVPMRREGEKIVAQPNEACICPCHVDGWMAGR